MRDVYTIVYHFKALRYFYWELELRKTEQSLHNLTFPTPLSKKYSLQWGSPTLIFRIIRIGEISPEFPVVPDNLLDYTMTNRM